MGVPCKSVQLTHTRFCSYYLLISFSIFASFVNCQIIVANGKCLNNKILVGSKCWPCPAGQLAIYNRCVAFHDAGPVVGESAIKSTAFSSRPIPRLFPRNCAKVQKSNPQKCMQCKVGYESIDGRCIQSGCQIYSQVLSKCMTDSLERDLEQLTKWIDSRNQRQSKLKLEISQDIYIVGKGVQKPKDKLDYNTLELRLSGSVIKINKQGSGPYGMRRGYPVSSMQNNSGSKGCQVIVKQRCDKCYEGYLLNYLSGTCIKVNSPLLITNLVSGSVIKYSMPRLDTQLSNGWDQHPTEQFLSQYQEQQEKPFGQYWQYISSQQASPQQQEYVQSLQQSGWQNVQENGQEYGQQQMQYQQYDQPVEVSELAGQQDGEYLVQQQQGQYIEQQQQQVHNQDPSQDWKQEQDKEWWQDWGFQ